MCPHTAVYVSSYCCICVLILLYVSSYCCICVLILLYMFAYTAIYVSSYCYMCPHTLVYVSSLHTSVLILLYMCPHSTTYASSGLNRNGHHASYYACAAIHTCGPLLSTLVLQAASWGGAVCHAWRVPSLCLPCFHDDPQKAKIPKRVSSLTHSPPQVF